MAKRSKHLIVILILCGSMAILGGAAGFINASLKSQGFFTQWQLIEKPPVENAEIVSATTDMVYITGNGSTKERIELSCKTELGGTCWKALSSNETIASEPYNPCWFQFKPRPFQGTAQQEIKTSYCSSGGFEETIYVLSDDNMIWFWKQTVSDFEFAFWLIEALKGIAVGFVIGGLLVLISFLFHTLAAYAKHSRKPISE